MNATARILLTALALATVTGLAGGLVVYPTIRQTAEDRATIESRRAELVKLQKVALRIKDLKREIERLEAALAFFESRLPKEREIDVILREVWLIADAKGLAPDRIQTNRPEQRARYNSQPITMSLEGSFDRFYEFLLGLERLPRITQIREMQLTKAPNQEGVVQVDLLMDIFCEK